MTRDATPAATRGRGRASGAERWLLSLARDVRGRLALAAGCGILSGLAMILQAGLLAFVLSAAIIEGRGPAALSVPLGALLAVLAVRAVCAWGMETAGISAAEAIKRTLRGRLFSHIAALGPVHTADWQAGSLAASVVDQVEAIEGYFARFFPQLAIVAVVPLTMLAAVVQFDWVAALILLLAAPLIPFFMALVGMGADHLSRQQMQALARMGGYFLDRLQGLPTLQLFRQQDREADRIAAASDELRWRTMRVLRVAFLSSAVLEFFSSVAIAVLAIYIGFALLGFFDFAPASQMSLFTGLFVLLLAPDFFQPLRQLAQHYHERASALGAAREMREILRRSSPPRPVTPVSLPQRRPAEARLEHVIFRYPSRPAPVLDGFSLDVAAGERVALAGPSGAGKSTVISLLLGFVRPDQGRVMINGCDLAAVDPDGIASASAWLGQRAHVFHGTIRDNVRLGRRDADEAVIVQAAERARVMEFAERLPRGLDTLVGERGFGLSGGQVRRIALARVMLKDAPLLLLDEPTAGLDPANEALILEALAELAGQGRTMVIATHGVAGMDFADRVVELRPAAGTAFS